MGCGEFGLWFDRARDYEGATYFRSKSQLALCQSVCVHVRVFLSGNACVHRGHPRFFMFVRLIEARPARC